MAADQPRDGAVAGEDAHHVRVPLALGVQPLQRVGTVDLQRVRLREVNVRQHLVLGAVHEVAELVELASELVGHHAPLGVRVLRCFLGEDRGNGRTDHAPLGLGRVRQRIAHEVHAAALPDFLQDLGDGCLDALVAVADDELARS